MSAKILRWCATCNEATESWFYAGGEYCVGCEEPGQLEDDEDDDA